jgi:hypothetical protein
MVVWKAGVHARLDKLNKGVKTTRLVLEMHDITKEKGSQHDSYCHTINCHVNQKQILKA